ncbi:MAG: ATP-binding protein [Ignavibacteriaceae bacterium]
MKNLFKRIISDFHKRELPLLQTREIEIPLNTGKIITLTGCRRTGKTYLFFQIIKSLLKETDIESIIYINFEDERLNLSTSDLNLIIEAYYELYPSRKGDIRFFFDEIQNVEGWEKFVRRIYDTVSKKIFITGSSSKLLSKEIATSLRGRTLSFEVFPFSFREFLKAKKTDPKDVHSTIGKSGIINRFEEYMQSGGFPETVNLSSELRTKTLQSYFDVMLYRDLIERYSINNSTALKYFIKKGISNTGSKFAVNKVYNELKSIGIKVSKDTLYSFIDYLHDAFILFPVNVWSESVTVQTSGEKKLYCIDNGLANAVSFRFSEDRGRMLENLVYLHLRRTNSEVFYNKGKGECDFVVKKRDKYSLYQVTTELNPANEKREISGLVEAMDKFNAEESFIITEAQSKEIKADRKKIHLIEITGFLLA